MGKAVSFLKIIVDVAGSQILSTAENLVTDNASDQVWKEELVVTAIRNETKYKKH